MASARAPVNLAFARANKLLRLSRKRGRRERDRKARGGVALRGGERERSAMIEGKREVSLMVGWKPGSEIFALSRREWQRCL